LVVELVDLLPVVVVPLLGVVVFLEAFPLFVLLVVPIEVFEELAGLVAPVEEVLFFTSPLDLLVLAADPWTLLPVAGAGLDVCLLVLVPCLAVLDLAGDVVSLPELALADEAA